MYSKIIRSGQIVEIFNYQYSPKNLNVPRRKKKNRTGLTTIRRRRHDHIRNSRRSFLRTVWANLTPTNPPTFVTLTFAQVLSYKASSIIFTQFLARLRRKFGRKFRCIAVPEYQERGAIHFHCLFWDLPIDYEKEAPHWETEEDFGRMEQVSRGSRYLQRLWLRGYVDCFTTDGHFAVAFYMAKYMSKFMQGKRLNGDRAVSEKGEAIPGGKKAYYTTRNCLRPLSAKGFVVNEYMDELVDIHSPTLQDKEYQTQFMGRCNYRMVEAALE